MFIFASVYGVFGSFAPIWGVDKILGGGREAGPSLRSGWQFKRQAVAAKAALPDDGPKKQIPCEDDRKKSKSGVWWLKRVEPLW